MSPVVRPPFVTDAHLVYLDELRESGETNMFGARPYLEAAFPELSKEESSSALSYWMGSFSSRHPKS